MEKHGLCERDIELSSVERKTQFVSRTLVPPGYLIMLIRMMESVFGVQSVLVQEHTFRGYKSHIDFIGIDAAPELAAYAFDVLKKQLVRGRDEYLGTLKRVKKSTKTRRANLWSQAWCRAVEQKVRTLAIPSMQRKLIEAWIDDHYKSLESVKPKVGRCKTRGDRDAIIGGFVAGSDVSIHPGVGYPGGVGLIS